MCAYVCVCVCVRVCIQVSPKDLEVFTDFFFEECTDDTEAKKRLAALFAIVGRSVCVCVCELSALLTKKRLAALFAIVGRFFARSVGLLHLHTAHLCLQCPGIFYFVD